MNDDTFVAEECYVAGSGGQKQVGVCGGESSSVDLSEVYAAVLA